MTTTTTASVYAQDQGVKPDKVGKPDKVEKALIIQEEFLII